MLFTDNISNICLENIETVRQHLREERPRNADLATVVGEQVHDTTVDPSAPTKSVMNTTGRLPTNTNKHLSTVDEEDNQGVMTMKSSHSGNPPRPTSRTSHTTSHSDARSRRASRKKSRLMSFARGFKREEPTDTYSSSKDDQGTLPTDKSSLALLTVVL